MNLSELGGPFTSQPCAVCSEEKYVDEPCPRCTAGDPVALTDRLEASMERERFLFGMIERMIASQLEKEQANDPPKV